MGHDEGALDGRPFPILDEEVRRTRGEHARSNSISAGVVLGDLVRTTLGPAGMDKMLVDDAGNVVVTNDGKTVLEEVDLRHPVPEIVLGGARDQDDEAGDGTTTMVVLVGELLYNAAGLLDRGVRSRTIIDGYDRAARRARTLLGEHAVEVAPDADRLLPAVARTAMDGGIIPGGHGGLADLAVRAVRAVTRDGTPDLDALGTEPVEGGAVADSRLVDGVLLNRDPVHPNMPARVTDARIALLDYALETRQPEQDTEAVVATPEQRRRFLDAEERQLRELVDGVVSTGADVVVTGAGIDEGVQYRLAEAGIVALRRATDADLDHLARATGARRIGTPGALGERHLGHAGLVEKRAVGGKDLTAVEECARPRSVTLLVRGGTRQVVESTESAVEDAFDVVASTIEDGAVLPGGGAPEVRLALALRSFAEGLGGREQLAVDAFADALEVVPRTLAANGGRDPLDALLELRSRHAAGRSGAGLDAGAGEIRDAFEAGIVEPLAAKRGSILRAGEIATMLLRIDGILIHPNDLDRKVPDVGGLDEAAVT